MRCDLCGASVSRRRRRQLGPKIMLVCKDCDPGKPDPTQIRTIGSVTTSECERTEIVVVHLRVSLTDDETTLCGSGDLRLKDPYALTTLCHDCLRVSYQRGRAARTAQADG